MLLVLVREIQCGATGNTLLAQSAYPPSNHSLSITIIISVFCGRVWQRLSAWLQTPTDNHFFTRMQSMNFSTPFRKSAQRITLFLDSLTSCFASCVQLAYTLCTLCFLLRDTQDRTGGAAVDRSDSHLLCRHMGHVLCADTIVERLPRKGSSTTLTGDGIHKTNLE